VRRETGWCYSFAFNYEGRNSLHNKQHDAFDSDSEQSNGSNRRGDGLVHALGSCTHHQNSRSHKMKLFN
jgi:hypothetical protein